MERIRKAVSRAKQERDKLPRNTRTPVQDGDAAVLASRSTPDRQAAEATGAAAVPADDLVKLDRKHLQDMLIFAHDGADRRSATYDMLRTQALQILKKVSLKTLAVTSPLAGAGKTVTSINLAFSIARQREQSVLLVDLDLRKTPIARCMGLSPVHGIDDVLAGTCTLEEAVIMPNLGQGRLSVLATAQPLPQSTERIASSEMRALTEHLAANEAYSVIIYDLPPMLSADDFLAFLPQVDCAMLVAAAGETTVHEIAECDRLIGDDKFLGCVLNKAAESEAGYGYYGHYG